MLVSVPGMNSHGPPIGGAFHAPGLPFDLGICLVPKINEPGMSSEGSSDLALRAITVVSVNRSRDEEQDAAAPSATGSSLASDWTGALSSA